MAEGCGHEVVPGARFCGTCGAAVGAAGAGPVPPSTPWPAARRGAVSIDKTPTVAVGLTTPFPPAAPPPAPPPPGATPPPPGGAVPPPAPPGPPPGPRSPSALDRRTPLILGGLVLVLVVVVLALSFKVLSGSDDDGDGDRIASDGTTEPTTSTTTTSAPTTPPPSSATTAPPTSAATVPATTAPPATAPPTSAPPPPSAPSTALADELVGTLDGYVSALDQGDLELAYSYLAVSLQEQEGWDRSTFWTFWTDTVVGAEVLSIDDVSTVRGTVTATVDYDLPDGGTSREQVVATFEPVGDAGYLAMVDYEVLDSERIG